MSASKTHHSTFTPLFDALVDYGFSLTERAIYGQIWRYSQFSEGRCTATIEALAKNIGVSKKTITRALARLEERGWVIDLTPELKNQSHSRIVRPIPENGQNSAPLRPDSDPVEAAAVLQAGGQNDPIDAAGDILTGSFCPERETNCPSRGSNCPVSGTICPVERVNLTHEDTIKETLKERIQETKLKKESHHHDAEPSFFENQSIAAEINTFGN